MQQAARAQRGGHKPAGKDANGKTSSWHGAMLGLLVVQMVLVSCQPRKAVESDESSAVPFSISSEPTTSVFKFPSQSATQRIRLGQSVQHRPIELIVLEGDPEDAVLVIGGIHGDEPTSVDVARGLAELLEAQPALRCGRLVGLIVNANPDGLAAGTRGNARGIDLNRNFPASNFKPGLGGRYRGGDSPLSEPESRVIADAVARIRPKLLISIHSIGSGRHCNNYDGPARHIAQEMSRHNGYPATATIGYATPGSLGSWAGKDLQIPMITLELPRRLDGVHVWAENRRALLAGIAIRTPKKTPDPLK
ncbi:M14 family zinc carboxypeptidase [Fontivita pretiosa]|uniref:M14 family zinc carboxypeptidase n=1 Tax=Fontivita pretiosa TaxID=2989684 RepID=UPI003D165FDA